MTCPQCGSANPAGARFCAQCGSALAAACARCTAPLPAGARFCASCGHPVGPGVPSPTPRAARLQPSQAHLAQLEAAGLVRALANSDEPALLFRHALVHEAVYTSLLRHERRRLHQAVGEVLEAMPAAGGERGLTAVLGRHFEEAGDRRRAAAYYTQAADAAAATYANTEAVEYYRRALAQASPLPDSDSEALIHLHSGLGRALELCGRPGAALDTYRALGQAADQRQHRPMALAALMAQAKVHALVNTEHDRAAAGRLLREALVLAAELKDQAAEARVLWSLMLHQIYGDGDFHQAVDYGQQALALARTLNLRELMAFTLNDLTYAYMALQDYAAARDCSEQAGALWQALGNQPMLVDSLTTRVLMMRMAGEWEAALATARTAEAIAQRIDNTWGQATVGFYTVGIYVERGEFDTARRALAHTLEMAAQAGHPSARVQTLMDQAWLMGLAGDLPRGLAVLEEAEAAAGSVPFLRLWPLPVRARLLLRQGDTAGAAAAVEAAQKLLKPAGLQMFSVVLLRLARCELALARGQAQAALAASEALVHAAARPGGRAYQPHALYCRAQALLAAGRPPEEAQAVLLQAQTAAEALQTRLVGWRICAALAALARQAGDAAEATAWHAAAAAQISFVASRCDEAAVRARFLAQPEVATIMAVAGAPR